MNRRVSDSGWTNEERAEVIEAFLERADKALCGPLFEDQDLSDPNGGIDMRLQLINNPSTGEQSIRVEYLVLEPDEYDRYIQLLRPFILSSEDIFLPKVARHARCLLKEQFKGRGDNLVNWIEGQVSFKKEFAPIFFYSSISNMDETDVVSGTNADIALDYIYGRSVKSEIDRLRRVRKMEAQGFELIADSLNAYLKQLMRLAYITARDIRQWDNESSFVCPLTL